LGNTVLMGQVIAIEDWSHEGRSGAGSREGRA
jgi:hypothetical protein